MATYTTSITGGATVATSARQVPAATAATTRTKALVGCGIVFGPLFYVVAIVQMVMELAVVHSPVEAEAGCGPCRKPPQPVTTCRSSQSRAVV